jgi:NhaP-type Na+/H+ or K+/H+ antiporter
LALLKEAGAPKKFNSLIEGESLFNDGTCMVLLTISLELVKGVEMQPLEIGVLFLELTVGAIVLGVIFGMISTFLIKLVKKDSILTINITVAMCYILYFISEFVYLGIRISGIMALVSIGLYMAAFGKTKFTAEAKEKTHEFWKVFVFIAETIIFILGGVMVGTKALSNDQLVSLIGSDEIINLGILYVCMTVARFLSIAVFMPKLQNEGYGLKWI